MREYVADTIFDSEMVDGEKARERRRRAGAAARRAAAAAGVADPLGLRTAPSDESDEYDYSGTGAASLFPPTPASDLRRGGRHINIYTTAALPWMTGTSINPLLRAAHLVLKGYNTTLLLPWLEAGDQVTRRH